MFSLGLPFKQMHASSYWYGVTICGVEKEQVFVYLQHLAKIRMDLERNNSLLLNVDRLPRLDDHIRLMVPPKALERIEHLASIKWLG